MKGDAVKIIMDVRNYLMSEWECDHEKVENMLDEAFDIIISDIKSGMAMFLAFHTALNEPQFSELLLTQFLHYLIKNDLIKAPEEKSGNDFNLRNVLKNGND